MSTLIADATLGLEDIQREAFIVCWENFDAALGAIAEKWDARDEADADRLGVPHVATELELVDRTPTDDNPTGNYWEGHVPSLINAPVENYPNLAVMCFRGTPGPQSDLFDHADQYLNSLIVDVMVKATNERDVNRRAHRMAEAAHLCLRSNSTLHGTVEGLNTAATADISDVFVRREKTKGHYGSVWYWQGARLSYGMKKMSSVATSSNGFMPSVGFPEVDQS